MGIRKDHPQVHISSALLTRSQFLLCLLKRERPYMKLAEDEILILWHCFLVVIN